MVRKNVENRNSIVLIDLFVRTTIRSDDNYSRRLSLSWVQIPTKSDSASRVIVLIKPNDWKSGKFTAKTKRSSDKGSSATVRRGKFLIAEKEKEKGWMRRTAIWNTRRTANLPCTVAFRVANWTLCHLSRPLWRFYNETTATDRP